MLIGRSQTIVLDGEFSNDFPVTSGIPQGFVLGPLLFLLYINDLIKSQVNLFAVDTVVNLTVSSSQDSQVLQADLDTSERWERTWDMEINQSKLKKKRQVSVLPAQLELECVDLGVTISKDLGWNTHIHNMCQC